MPDEVNQRAITRVGVIGVVIVLVVAGGIVLGGVPTTPTAADGVSEDQQDASDPALVRFAHTGADVLAVNVTIDGETVLTDVQYGNVSGYLRVVAGTHTVTVEEARVGGDVLFETEIEFEGGENYTIAGAGEVTTGEAFEPIVLRDNLSAPSENQSSVRLVHLSPDAPAVDVTVAETGRVLFDDVSYRNASAYVTMPAGNHTLEVRPATPKDTGPVVATVNVTLEGGNATTAFAIGYLSPPPGFDRPLEVVLADPVVSEPSPDTMITPTPAGSPAETPTETPENETGG